MKKKILILAVILTVSNVAAQSSQKVDVELKKTEPVPLQSSEYADVWLEVTNEGDNAARNVNVSFEENFPFSVDPDEKKWWNIKELTPGEEYQLRMEVRVDENAVQGSNTLNFDTSFGDISVVKKVPVEVRSDNNILSVHNITFPETVPPGQNGKMEIELQNMADGQLKNIEVSLDVSDDSKPFATIGSSKQNIESLPSGETEKVSFRLEIDESADNGVYKLPVEFEYENEAGTSFESSSTKGVVVGGEPKLEAGINTEKQLTPGSQETLSFRVVNRGYGSADFVQMKLERSENFELLSPKTVYLGDMDSDDFQTAEYSLYINENTSELEIPLELSYSDRNGEQTQFDSKKVRVYSQEELQQRGLASSDNLPIILGGAVLVIVIALFLLRRRRKKKR